MAEAYAALKEVKRYAARLVSHFLGLLETDLICWPWEDHFVLVMVYVVYVALIDSCAGHFRSTVTHEPKVSRHGRHDPQNQRKKDRRL